MPCFVRIQDDRADKIENSRPKEPARKYAQTARCVDFVPHPQHDELPTVNCLKLGRKLENFKDLIKRSSKKVLKSDRLQIDSSVIKLQSTTGLNSEDSLFEQSKKDAAVAKNASPAARKSTAVGKGSPKPTKSKAGNVRKTSLNQSLLTPVVYSISSL